MVRKRHGYIPAAVYVLIGAALAATFVPERRIGWRNTAILLIAFVAVISPNLIWNVTHQFLTVRHTVDDNVGLGQGAGGLHWRRCVPAPVPGSTPCWSRPLPSLPSSRIMSAAHRTTMAAAIKANTSAKSPGT